MTHFTRRTALAVTLAATTALTLPGFAIAQDKPTLRLSSVVSDNDIRAEAFAEIAEAVSDTFDMQVFNGATLASIEGMYDDVKVVGSAQDSLQAGEFANIISAAPTTASAPPGVMFT